MEASTSRPDFFKRRENSILPSLRREHLDSSAFLLTLVGYWALFFGVVGAMLAIIYTAPPFKLDYRGLGLGELSILFAFGPLPVSRYHIMSKRGT